MSFNYARAIEKIIREELKRNNPMPDILGFQNLKALYEDKLFEQLEFRHQETINRRFRRDGTIPLLLTIVFPKEYGLTREAVCFKVAY